MAKAKEKPKARPRVKHRKKHLGAASLTLVDSKGRPRIFLDAGTEEGYACIGVYAKDGKSIQISAQPNDSLLIMLYDGKSAANIQISMSSDRGGGLWISDKKGLPGAIIGEEPDTSTHRLLLFKKGKPFWSTPTGGKKLK